MGVGAPKLRTDWNREIGVTRRDKRLGGASGDQDKVITRMLVGVSRDYALLDQERVDKQRDAITAIPWASVRGPADARRPPSNPRRKAKKKTERVPLTIVVDETPSLVDRMSLSEGQSSDAPLRATQGGKSPRVLKRMEEEETRRKRSRDEVETSGEEEEEDLVSLADRRVVKRKLVKASEDVAPKHRTREECLEVARKKREEQRRRETLEGGATDLAPEEQRGVERWTPVASASGPRNDVTQWSAPTGRPSVSRESLGEGSAMGRHHFSFEYRGPHPIVADPFACEELLGSIPEVVEGVSESELSDPKQNRGEIVAAHVLLMSLENRRERGHQKEVSELKRKIELRDQEREKLRSELAAEKERARVREAELAAGARQVEKLRSRVEELQQDLGRRDEELDFRTRGLKESEEKLKGMGGLCRRRMRKALKDQLAVFKESCQKQSQNAVGAVQGYLKARGRWEAADRLLSQAKGAMQVLMGLQRDGVPIPDDAIARLVKEEMKCTQERAGLEVEGLSSDDFKFNLPSDLGIPNLEQIDFGAGVLMGSEDEPESPRGSDDKGEEDEEEDSEDDEEEAESGEEDSSEEEVISPSAVRAEPRSTEETGLPPSENPEIEMAGGRSETQVQVPTAELVGARGDVQEPAMADLREGDEGRVRIELPPVADE